MQAERLNRFVSIMAIAIALMVTPALVGQHYEAQTLDFANVTATNVNPTVAETNSDLEKEVEFGDIDNDGDLDCVIAVAVGAFGERLNKMYMNDGGVFNEVSGTTLIPGFAFEDVSRNVFLRDYDQDGWLDLIVVNDSNDGDSTWDSSGTTKYYENLHPGGVFTGFVNATNHLNGARGAACSAFSTDINNDGKIDLFMANYPFTSQDTMYFNGVLGQPLGFFQDMTSSHVRIESDYAVDCVMGDLNGDGKKDVVIGSTGDNNFIVYNDNRDNGQSDGDFQYPGATNHTQFAVTNYWPAFEISDFDGDDMNDLLYINKGGFGNAGTDVIMLNQGNDGDNKATFVDFPLPSVVASDSRKATVTDLDGNGLEDIIIMSRSRRPYIYRNMSTEGNLKFIEWTPADAFPSSSVHEGWHTGAGDVNNDGRVDLLLGGHTDDHLFHNQLPSQYDENSLGGNLPAFHNGSPICVIGEGVKAVDDVYVASGIPSGATVSMILRSFSDTTLEVYNSSGTLIASSDDGLAHVGESVQFQAPGGDIEVRVKMVQVSGDVNNDGLVNLADAALLRGFFLSRAPEAMIVDFDANGVINFLDAKLFRSRFSFGAGKDGYVLELNSRTN